ncbi:MAG TPA: hypothetical protein VIU40_06900 [Geobacteraceae bacterium]
MTTTSMPAHRRLVAAGWLAMTSALLTVPWFILVFVLGNEGAWGRWAQGGLVGGGTLIYVFLMVTLKRLLNDIHAFHRTDGVIALLVATNIVSALGEGVGLLFPSLGQVLGLVGVVMVVAIGILQVIFGVRFLRLGDALQGLRAPYGYLTIASGSLLASVVLLPVGVLVSGVADVMLGTIFLQAASALTPSPLRRGGP